MNARRYTQASYLGVTYIFHMHFFIDFPGTKYLSLQFNFGNKHEGERQLS